MSRDAASPWRARRLYDLLKANPKMSMDDVSAAQMDAYNIPLAAFAAEVVKLNAASQPTLDVLKGWDGVMRPESKAAVIASEIRLCTAEKIGAANPGVPAGLIMARVIDLGVIAKRPEAWVPKPFVDYASVIRACDGELTAALGKKYGTDPNGWTWAAVSKARFPHPLAAAPLIGVQFATPTLGISGSRESPNVASFVSMRHIASPGNWDATRHVIPLGQSGDPRSPHYKDQFEAWRTGSPAVFPFSAAEVGKATVTQMTFSPPSRP
jgi:penicillin amidase